MASENYCALLHNAEFTDNFMRLSGRKGRKDKNDLFVIDNDKAFIMTMPRQTLKPSNRLFLLLVLSQLTEQGVENFKDTSFRFSLKEYSELRNISLNKAREKVKEDLDALLKFSIELKVVDPKTKEYYKGDYIKFNILQAVGRIKMNTGIICFTEVFLNYLAHSYILKLPKEAFKIDTRYNPNSFDMFWKLAHHYNVNRIKDKNKNIIKVSTLLEYCSAIPRYDSKMKKTGGVRQRIIEPFIRDLNAIKNISDWYFLDRQNNKIAPNDIKHYIDFVDLKVYFDWNKEYKQEIISKKSPIDYEKCELVNEN